MYLVIVMLVIVVIMVKDFGHGKYDIVMVVTIITGISQGT